MRGTKSSSSAYRAEPSPRQGPGPPPGHSDHEALLPLCFLKKALMMGHAYNEPREVWLVKLTRHVAAAPLAERTPAEGATSVIKSIFRLTPLALAALGAACSEGSTTTSSASASSTGGVSG